MKNTHATIPEAAHQVRYFLYARKSTDDASRQLRSIGDQLAEAKLLASREGLDIVEVLTEKQSAKVPGRPVFNAMMDRIQRGEASGIIAWHPDRLARNAMDAGRVIHLIDLGLLKDLRFPTFRFEATAQGKFMLSIMLGQSKYYVDNLSENITRGKRNKIMSGIWPQAAPLGYVNDRVSRTIAPDPVHGPLVTQMFEMYATGDFGLKELREIMLAKGLRSPRGKPPSVSKVQLALTNPIYYGLLRYKGEFYEGKHAPLVNQALFDRCREVMHRKGRMKSSGLKEFAYRGLIRCGECGGVVTLHIAKGHHYLRCSKKKGPCGQLTTREEAVNAQVIKALESVGIDEPLRNEILEGLDSLKHQRELEVRSEQERLRMELARSDQRLQRLMSVYLDQAISLEEYRESKNLLVQEKKGIESRLSAVADASTAWFQPRVELVKSSHEALCVARRGDAAESLRVFKTVGFNLTLRDRRLAWAPRGAWQLLVDQEVAGREAGGAGPGSAEEKPAERAERIKRRGRDSNPR